MPVLGFKRVLIANRGEIAVRVTRACQSLGLESVVAVSQADRDSLPARMATRAVCIGPAPARDHRGCNRRSAARRRRAGRHGRRS